jgi:hypothetical protein
MHTHRENLLMWVTINLVNDWAHGPIVKWRPTSDKQVDAKALRYKIY